MFGTVGMILYCVLPFCSGYANPEIKVAPGAELRVWRGTDIAEPEIVSIVDKKETFTNRNASHDPASRGLRSATLKWTGILNVSEPGTYVFSLAHEASHNRSSISFSVNGVQVVKYVGGGALSKKVTIPGAVFIELTLYASTGVPTIDRARTIESVLIRYKKDGDIQYTSIAPIMLYHAVE